ncbi:hypothetical protein SAMN05443575_0741 [Jatrophihabitans endophyticus]|uniref:PKD domain-containing protein n=1 Tax=Jatrophihabitans endophyticus TaxID=1206085 RepID=A0A1M5DZM4_9ACTN|nr:hypothetical protein [Jatrophihabitans endophyticus]SHF72366.1 hypothetical protein SAMN05443575_0741 [Jatrophihabitans endophyticus]
MRLAKWFGVLTSSLLVVAAAPATASADDPEPWYADGQLFRVTSYDGPGKLIAHLELSPDARALMASGENLSWDWGDGTSCQSDPPTEANYVADGNSTCSDPDTVTHVYPALPSGYYTVYTVGVARRPGGGPVGMWGYASATELLPGWTYTGREYTNLVTYDDQPVSLDLTAFAPRHDQSALTYSADVSEPRFGSVAVSSGVMTFTPARTGHTVLWAGMGYRDGRAMGLNMAIRIDAVPHAAPRISSLSCAATASGRSRRHTCGMRLHNADRRTSTSRYTTTITKASGRRAVVSRTTVEGQRDHRVTVRLARGTYTVRVAGASHRSTTRTFRVKG